MRAWVRRFASQLTRRQSTAAAAASLQSQLLTSERLMVGLHGAILAATLLLALATDQPSNVHQHKREHTDRHVSILMKKRKNARKTGRAQSTKGCQPESNICTRLREQASEEAGAGSQGERLACTCDCNEVEATLHSRAMRSKAARNALASIIASTCPWAS
jgi:hypothetical protein